MQDLSTTTLADLIDKRHRLLAQFLAIGRKQSELIATDETGSLLRLLAAKNQLIGALRGLESRLAPFHDQDPEAREWASQAVREACAAKADECKRMLEELMRLEKQNELAMTVRRDEVAERLQVASGASAASQAYRANQQAHAPHKTAAPHASLDIGTTAPNQATGT